LKPARRSTAARATPFSHQMSQSMARSHGFQFREHVKRMSEHTDDRMSTPAKIPLVEQDPKVATDTGSEKCDCFAVGVAQS
jgi:hypothetical protein